MLTVNRNTHDHSVALENWHELTSVYYRSWRSSAWTDQHVYLLELYHDGEGGNYSLWWNWRTGDDDSDWHFESGTEFIGETPISFDLATEDDICDAFETLWQRLADQLKLTKE